MTIHLIDQESQVTENLTVVRLILPLYRPPSINLLSKGLYVIIVKYWHCESPLKIFCTQISIRCSQGPTLH